MRRTVYPLSQRISAESRNNRSVGIIAESYVGNIYHHVGSAVEVVRSKAEDYACFPINQHLEVRVALIAAVDADAVTSQVNRVLCDFPVVGVIKRRENKFLELEGILSVDAVGAIAAVTPFINAVFVIGMSLLVGEGGVNAAAVG